MATPYLKSFKPRRFSNATDRHAPVTSIVDSEKHAPSVGGEPVLSRQIQSNIKNYELRVVSPVKRREEQTPKKRLSNNEEKKSASKSLSSSSGRPKETDPVVQAI